MRRLGFFLILLCVTITTGLADPKDLPSLPGLGELQFIWPITNPTITSKFGHRSHIKLDSGGTTSSLHFGLDLIPTNATLAQVNRTPILAAEAGEVFIVYPAPNGYYRGHPTFGGCVMVRHLVGSYGDVNVYAYTLYAHLKEVWVTEKTKGLPTVVKKGQTLGLMGTTGVSTGPHLHFEILFDPLDFLLLASEILKDTQMKDREVEARRHAYYRQSFIR